MEIRYSRIENKASKKGNNITILFAILIYLQLKARNAIPNAIAVTPAFISLPAS